MFSPLNDIVQYPSIFSSLPCKQITPNNIDFMKHSLELCTSTCHRLQRVERPPTRLLDLGPVEFGYLRLIHTKDVPEADVPSLKYAALSYCWGNKKVAATQPITTPKNLEKRTERISLKEMSTVAKDAIQLCIALDIRYLWIDALCILQGRDKPAREDWELESQFMDTIYAQAYFTICAASSPSCQVSFLQGAPKPRLRIGLRPASSDAFGGSYLMIPSSFKYIHYQSDWDTHVWRARAWTVQERMLSERLIIFGTSMIHFICSGFYSIGTGSTDTCRMYNADTGVVKLPTKPLQPLSDQDHRAQIFQEFRKTLSSVARADLTVDRDRMPALAGVAKRVHELTGSKYYAGCWEDDLHNDLPFRLDNPPPSTAANPRGLGPEQYFGPSWSFVSRNNGKPVNLDFSDSFGNPGEPQYDSIQASTTLQGISEFGEVTGGILKIQTKVLLTSVNLEMEEMNMGVWLGGGQVYFDGQDLKDQCACVSNPDGDDMAWALISAWPVSKPFLFLGLLLRSTGSAEKPREYYRIGSFKWEIRESNGPTSWATEAIEII